MVVAQIPARVRHILKLHGRLQHHADVELFDHRALDLLPGRLALRVLVAAGRLELGADVGDGAPEAVLARLRAAGMAA